MTIREKLLEVRRKHNIRQVDAALTCGISRETISNIESGAITKPNSLTLFCLNRLFRVYGEPEIELK